MRNLKLLLISLLSISLLTGFSFGKKNPEEKRAEIDQTAGEVLSNLFHEEPQAEDFIEQSAGYAVFSSIGVNVMVLSTASGKGVVVRKNGDRIYMKMFSAGVGIGMGIKDFRLIFVFDNDEVMDTFIEEGWTAGAQADAAATHDDEGDAATLAIDISPGVRLFQLTESGLALQATIQGTRYLKNDDLN